MHVAGIVLLVASVTLVLATGVAARWRLYGSGEITGRTLRRTAFGLAGVIAGVLLLALASR